MTKLEKTALQTALAALQSMSFWGPTAEAANNAKQVLMGVTTLSEEQKSDLDKAVRSSKNKEVELLCAQKREAEKWIEAVLNEK